MEKINKNLRICENIECLMLNQCVYSQIGYLPYLPVSIIDMVGDTTTAGVVHIICCALDPAYCIFGALYYIDKVSHLCV